MARINFKKKKTNKQTKKEIQIRLHNNQENGGFFIYENCTSGRKALWVTLAL